MTHSTPPLHDTPHPTPPHPYKAHPTPPLHDTPHPTPGTFLGTKELFFMAASLCLPFGRQKFVQFQGNKSYYLTFRKQKDSSVTTFSGKCSVGRAYDC